jgi:hypothetical protein
VWLEKHDNNNNSEWDLNNFAWSARQPAVLKEKTTTMVRLAGRSPAAVRLTVSTGLLFNEVLCGSAAALTNGEVHTG